MKKSSLLLLGLIAGLALTSCGESKYYECKAIKIENVVYTPAEITYYTVARYITSSGVDIATEVKEGDSYKYYIYCSVIFSERLGEPEFPEYAHLTEEVGTNQLVSYGLTLDYVVGKYKTYTKLYLSKDQKTLKVFESYFEPVKAPHDKEIQGKTTYNVFLKENAKIDDNFSNIGGRPMRIETRSETTFSNVEGKVQEFTYFAE